MPRLNERQKAGVEFFIYILEAERHNYKKCRSEEVPARQKRRRREDGPAYARPFHTQTEWEDSVLN